MRMFAALLPPPDALEHLEEFLDVRREHGAFRWTLAEQLHVTVAFYPAVPERCLDDLVEALGSVGEHRRAIDVAVAGGGAFPHVGAAKVLWAGLDLTEESRAELDRIAVGCRSAAGSAGVAVDGQRFRPHLTLARLGRPREVSRWVRLLDAYDGPRWRTDSITLVASHLGEGPARRPRYEVVSELPLGWAG